MTMTQTIIFIFALNFFAAGQLSSFDKVIIWGHKLHSHTHSYIHNAFFRAFNFLGYETFWLDDKEDTSDFDFSNSLFIIEGQAAKNIPLRNDCRYIFHNWDGCNYKNKIEPYNWICFQVYTHDILNLENLVKVDNCIYYDLKDQCVYMPWATDLLPHEIDRMKTKVGNIPIQDCVYWIGTIGRGIYGNIDQLIPFVRACLENNVNFQRSFNLTIEDSIDLICRSYMAPTILGEWQVEKGYIPCRIFKNISYGKMGITNSKTVYDFFEQKIVYNPDTYQLYYDAKKKMETLSYDEIFELMDFVKNKHTYINRIELLLTFFELVQQNSHEN